MKVKLKAVIDAIECADDGSMAFFDMTTGTTVYLWDAQFDGPENQRLAEQIEATPERYLRFPTKYEIHEYSIIKDFVNALPDGPAQRELTNAIRGKGAFRRFKQGIRYHGIEQQWYVYRDNAFRELAIGWCNANNIGYERSI